MPGTVKDADALLKNPTKRAKEKLKSGQTLWCSITADPPVHLGYQKWKGGAGRWIVRRNLGKFVSKTGKEVYRYSITELGCADDHGTADGLTFDDAKRAVQRSLDTGRERRSKLTVRQAFERYVEFKTSQGQPTGDLLSRGTAHILSSPLADKVVVKLTSEEIRRWLFALASSPAMIRSKKNGKQAFKPESDDDEAIRRRRSSANRVLTMLKAALNHAYDEGHVDSNEAWGRRVKPFREVEVARIRHLTVAEAQRGINASDPDFRLLVQAALQTGCRYSELTRLEVHDFNDAQGTVAIRKSKTGKPRHVILTDEGAIFFKQVTAGRAGNELIFTRANGTPWKASQQGRPMREACERAKIKPVISFHGLRHTWASLSVMAGVPLMVVARNLGHVDTRMVEKHYGHLAPSFIVDAIRAGAPKFGFKPDRKVATLAAKRR